MSRLIVRLGALALSSAALAACALAQSDSDQPTGRADQAAYGAALSTSFDDEIRNAQTQRAHGDFSGAVRTLSQLMLVSPDDPRVVGEYGKVLAQQGRSAEAVQFLSRAVELQPSDWALYSALGVAYDQSGDAAAARTAYDHALALKPGEAVVLNNYAMSRMLAGDLAQAHRLMIAAAATGSHDPQIARNLALLQGLDTAPVPAPARAVADSAAKPVSRIEVTTKPLPAASEPAADHAPKPLFASTAPRQAPVQSKPNEPQTVMMQEVPFDPKAGPVSKKVSVAKHTPRKPATKLAAKLGDAPKLRKTVTPVTANKIPALRMAADRS